MREFKFRAWDETNQCFDYINFNCNTNKECNDCGTRVYMALCHENEITQFTGKEDRNGKEIYEGDIVKVNHPMGEEFYGEVFFRYDGCFAHTFLEGRPSKRMWKYCEVVGNMFENPEMME